MVFWGWVSAFAVGAAFLFGIVCLLVYGFGMAFGEALLTTLCLDLAIILSNFLLFFCDFKNKSRGNIDKRKKM